MSNAFYWLLNSFKKSEYKLATADAWKNIFDLNDPNIQLIIRDLAIYCNFHHTSFVKDNPYQTSFNEGARDVFLHLLEMANIDVDAVVKLIKEIDNNDKK